ncbi:MAG TPA: hypothetical protein VK934_10475 [Fimbriimonas sp.]|nr:hypothetical protein [Fimbriimonas sp.]
MPFATAPMVSSAELAALLLLGAAVAWMLRRIAARTIVGFPLLAVVIVLSPLMLLALRGFIDVVTLVLCGGIAAILGFVASSAFTTAR